MLSANGGITCDTTKFTVANESGNTSIGGTLNVTNKATFLSDISCNLNTNINGTLDVKGNTTLAGLLSANGGITCDTTKFTVANGTGNTNINGTLGVKGNTNINGTLGVKGNTSLDGTLGVTGTVTSSYKSYSNYNTGFKGSFEFNSTRNDSIATNWSGYPLNIDSNDNRTGNYNPFFNINCLGNTIYAVNYNQGDGGIRKQGLHLVPATINTPPTLNSVYSGVIFQTYHRDTNNLNLCIGVGGVSSASRRMQIYGGFYASSGSIGSDNRIKFNQRDIQGNESLESIMKMTPKKYTKIISNYENSKIKRLPNYNGKI